MAAVTPEKAPEAFPNWAACSLSLRVVFVFRIRFCSASVYGAPKQCQALSCSNAHNPILLYIMFPLW